jgi:putative oxidoreductase
MVKYQSIASFFLRLSLSAGFLSAVASRLGFWGSRSSGWKNFLAYTAEVNSFAPKNIMPPVAITSTIVETTLGILLFIGFKTRLAAGSAAVLTLLFAIAMSISFGIKEPLDYSVFAFSASSLLLATLPEYQWSIDSLFIK